MTGDRGPDRPIDDNPYARPVCDQPAEIAPDAGLGRVAGWIFLILGMLGVAQMLRREAPPVHDAHVVGCGS